MPHDTPPPSPTDPHAPVEPTYSLQDLVNLSGTSLRTLRSWTAQRLLPHVGRGPYVRYGASHLLRIQFIRTMQARNFPLAQIRAHLESMSDAQLQTLLEPAPGASVVASRVGSAADYASAILSRQVSSADAFRRVVARSTVPAPPTGPPPLSASIPTGAHSAPGPRRSNWERVAFGPDLEIHVRRPLSREHNRRLDELLSLAAKLFGDDSTPQD